MNEHPSRINTPFERWRFIKDGGDLFVEEYLESREAELDADFSARRDMTPDPGTASSAIDDVTNSFVARMDVTRSGGDREYQEVIAGKLGGVDHKDTDLQTYMIKETVPELCYMSKFAWIVQNFSNPDDPYKTPYIIPVRGENIWNWTYVNNELVAVALRDFASVVDPDTGFSTEEKEVYRVFRLLNGSVTTHLEDAQGEIIDPITLLPGGAPETLDIDEIPVVIFELPIPLLKRIDRFQIAVLNMESADIDWLRTANLPLYVEQGNPMGSAEMLNASIDPTVTTATPNISLGAKTGRLYGMNANQPDFISPPADPIRVSMEKQKDLALRCKEILKTTMSDLSQASAESISLLGQGMEAGLFAIGTVLALGEIKFARIFHKYIGKDYSGVTISYPKKYELRTESERLSKAESLKEVQKKVGSNIAKQALEIQVIQTLLEGKISNKDYEAAIKEVLDSDFCIYDPDTVISLSKEGIISKELASLSVGAPNGDSAKAAEEYIARILAVQVSQTSGTGALASGTGLDPDPAEAERLRKEPTDEVPDLG